MLLLLIFAALGPGGAYRPPISRPRGGPLVLLDVAYSSTPAYTSAIQYSGSSGAALDLKGVCVSVGNNDLIKDVEWTIMPYERWAIVGQNGVGKSTLLKAITNTGGELVNIREGNVIIAKKARIGYLEQKGVSGSVLTVRQEVSSRMDRLTTATKALEEAEKRVAEGDASEEALTALDTAAVEFEAAGGYTVEQKIGNVLKGLGFVETDYDKLCSEFSGGWQMRIALARLLLSEPDLLFLDEPTNHLDKGNELAKSHTALPNTLSQQELGTGWVRISPSTMGL